MPPVPPARRQQAAVASPAKALNAKHRRFLHLLCSSPEHPSQGLGQDRFDALPQACRDALAIVVTGMPYLDSTNQAALEAYYGSGHRPANEIKDPYWWEEDLRRATALMAAPNGDIVALMAATPALSDEAVLGKLAGILTSPELKAGEKIRLEALRLVAELKGWRRDDQAAAVQATQIVIHTSQEPTVKPQNEPKVIEIEL